MVSILRDYDVRAGLDQALALPGVDAAALHLIAGHGDGHAAGSTNLLDFDKTVAKAQQLFAAQVVLLQDPLDDHSLRKILVLVERSVDVLGEVRSQPEQLGLVPDVLEIRAAGKVQSQAAPA